MYGNLKKKERDSNSNGKNAVSFFNEWKEFLKNRCMSNVDVKI